MVFRYSHQNQQHVQDAMGKLDGRIVVTATVAVSDQRSYTGITQGAKTRAQETPQVIDETGRPYVTRTRDQRIKSPLLYQLS